ncbi:serine protease [Actinomadura spongiicola]|uniref:Serine protease n=1 Tax=Actinomadura spongiicola TaxID=2303421 RepID=A0A372GFT1_9ACTN|nr:serine protease [Actinomadura spongiicola]RFS84245.1 serine protease [Actinomadura spongiicola]
MRHLRSALIASLAALLCLGLSAPAASAAPADPGPPGSGGTVSPMIIGGSDAPAPYSFMVSLQTARDGHFCGGSLLTADWVVTAQHCVSGKSPEDVELRVGSLRLDSGGSARRAERFVPHPEGSPARFDLALVRLDQPVPNAPVRLDVRQPVGASVRLLGWGCTQPGVFCGDEGRPEVLQQLDSAVRQPAACVNISAPIDPNSEVCTGNPDTATGPCFGDSGGPMLRRTVRGWRLIGAFSRVEVLEQDPSEPPRLPDCRTGKGIYTDLTVHATWIDSVITGSG